MENIKATLQYYSKRKLFKYALPFMLLVVGGSFGLKEFAQIRYQFNKKKTLRPDEVEDAGVKMKKSGEVTLESEFEKIKSLDIDNWDNVRVARPWEEKQL